MTTVIIAMNRETVALAADSAAFIMGGKKISMTNKLFMLLRNKPIGIMIYNNADINGVPIESLIKEYRKCNIDKDFSDLSSYLVDFTDFLSRFPLFATSDNQEFIILRYALSCLNQYYENFRQLDEKIINEIVKTKKKTTFAKIRNDYLQLFEMYTDYNIKTLEKSRFIDQMTQMNINEFLKENDTIIEKTIISFFKDKKSIYAQFNEISTQCISKLKHLIACSLFKDDQNWNSVLNTGVIIAGFGKRDTFPKFAHIRIKLIYKKIVLHYDYLQQKIDTKHPAIVEAFAQKDVASAYLSGVHPSFLGFIHGTINDFFHEFIQNRIEKIQIDVTSKKIVSDTLSKDADEYINSLKEESSNIIENNKWDTLMGVSFLSKEEIALFAESLVNITSLKRKVSLDYESVGGPTDVAVISKGDGFIWMKRKHYFKPELNPDYFRNLNNIDYGKN